MTRRIKNFGELKRTVMQTEKKLINDYLFALQLFIILL